MNSLFGSNFENTKPLYTQLRPKTLEEFQGQEKLLGEKGILKKLILDEKIVSSIFYGPPGCGKSTLGEIISNISNCYFVTLNATTDGLNELKNVIEKARENIKFYNKKTILFLDEIHRFNKLQQDALLSYCEDGTIILIGATTENPYYNLNNALLSRVMIFEFEPLKDVNILRILNKGVEKLEIENISTEILNKIVAISQGDSRIALNYLELYHNSYQDLNTKDFIELLEKRNNSYHKKEDKFNLISALIKSMRGSNPDSALYWLGRLLDGGEDPRYIARRLVVHASEDIGMANPEAMLIANSALMASERIGMPEIRIILAQAVVYIAISTKSNSCYLGIDSVLEDIKQGEIIDIPNNISHNPRGYLYPHDYKNNFVKQNYGVDYGKYYKPQDNKFEKLIKEKLDKLWK